MLGQGYGHGDIRLFGEFPPFSLTLLETPLIWHIPLSEIPRGNYGDTRPSTVGVIIHSTRGGAAYGTEYGATINWFRNPASFVSAHYVVARSGQVAALVPEQLMAYHAGWLNASYLGIEFEQPTIDDDFTEEQYRSGAWLVREMAKRWGFGTNRGVNLLGHDETIQGRQAGKSDPGPKWDWGGFLGLVTTGAAA